MSITHYEVRQENHMAPGPIEPDHTLGSYDIAAEAEEQVRRWRNIEGAPFTYAVEVVATTHEVPARTVISGEGVTP